MFWNFNHFLVVEGFRRGKVYLSDPATGPRVVSEQEFDQSFTGVVLVCQKGDGFKKGGQKPSLYRSLKKRLPGSRVALLYLVLATLALVAPVMVSPVLSRVFIDSFLISRQTHWLKPLLVTMAITGAVQAGVILLQQSSLGRMEMKLSLTASAKFFWHVLRMPVEFFVVRFGGEIGSRVEINDRVAGLLAGDLATNAVNCRMIGFCASCSGNTIAF